MKKVIVCVLFIACIGCQTKVPEGWSQANAQAIKGLLSKTDGILASATQEDRDYLTTLGTIVANAYETAALSQLSKEIRLLFAIQQANEFSKMLPIAKDPITVLRRCYGSPTANDTELWIAFLTHQVQIHRKQQMGLKCP